MTKSLALGDQPLTLELLMSLQRFRHVIRETLLLTSPKSRAMRIAVRDTIVPSSGGQMEPLSFSWRRVQYIH
jgi:hypothetical protein